MALWFRKDRPSTGSVLFRGSLPPRPENLGLERLGIAATALAAEGAFWRLELSHPEWGPAEVTCTRAEPPPPELFEHSQSLTPDEKRLAQTGERLVAVTTPSRRNDVLRDRKNLLRYLAAVAGGWSCVSRARGCSAASAAAY